MATITRRELVDQTASKVGALGAGQSLAAEDLDVIDRMVDALFDQLAEDEIMTVGDDEQIPASWSPYLASLLANLVGPDYGIPFTQEVKQVNEAILHKLVRVKETRETLSVDYY
jgi:hypothetical protein